MRLSRPLDEAITAADLTRGEHKALRALIRCSYGFARSDTGALAGYARLCLLTGLHRSRLGASLKGLRDKGVVIVVQRGSGAGGRVSVYRVVKDYERWTCLPPGWAPLLGSTEPGLPDSKGPQNRDSKGPQNRDSKGPQNRDSKGPQNRDSGVPIPWTPEKRVRREEREQHRAPAREGGAWTMQRVWARLVGGARNASPAQASRILTILDGPATDDEHDERIRRAGCGERPFSLWSSLYDDAGAPLPVYSRTAEAKPEAPKERVYLSFEEEIKRGLI